MNILLLKKSFVFRKIYKEPHLNISNCKHDDHFSMHQSNRHTFLLLHVLNNKTNYHQN